MGEIIIGIIGEFIAYLFIDFLFKKLIAPVFKFIGTLIKWIFHFGKIKFRDIWKSSNNTTLGAIITGVIIIISLVIVLLDRKSL